MATAPGLLEPLRIRAFRALWIAQFVSFLGTWMQTVAAQWFVTSSGASPGVVAAVQTAATVPLFLFGLPAGVIADRVNRRHLIVGVQAGMAVLAAAVAVLQFGGWLTTPLLLAATFLLGAGTALTGPVMGAVVPDLVGRQLVPQAAAINSVAFNITRLAGPALAGALVAVAGPAWVFALNAVSYLAILVAATGWSFTAPTHREPVWDAIRAGIGFVRFSPNFRRLLLRAIIWMVPACSIWALLPVVAKDSLGLGAAGYGLLLGSLGVGALVGALSVNRVRRAVPANVLIAGCSTGYALATVGLALSTAVVTAVASLLVAGLCWMVVMSIIMANAQMVLPRWVSGRGMGMFLIVFAGSQALGSILWGVVASDWGVTVSLVASAVVLAASALSVRRWGLHPVGDPELAANSPWTEPELPIASHDADRAVLVEICYDVAPEHVAEFVDLLPALARSRRSTGARRWQAFQDPTRPDAFVETYLVASWTEHLHQVGTRQTVDDTRLVRQVVSLTEGQPETRHLLEVPVRVARAGGWRSGERVDDRQ